MKRLFMQILAKLYGMGDITQANMYQDVSTIDLHTEDGDYVVTIRRIKKDEEKENAN